jgi:hypothetical protein
MYASLRWYNVQPWLVDEMIQRVQDGFVPIISGAPGFIAYYVVNAGNAVVVTVSIFDDKAGSDRAQQMAADWVARNLGTVIRGLPTITAGEVPVYKLRE